MNNTENEYKLSSEELHAIDEMNDKVTCAKELLEMMGTRRYSKKGIRRSIRGNRVHIVASVPSRNVGIYASTTVKIVAVWALMLLLVRLYGRYDENLRYAGLIICDCVTVWSLYKLYRVSNDTFHRRMYTGENFYKEIKDVENEKALVDAETAILLRYIGEAEDVMEGFYERAGIHGEMKNPIMAGFMGVMVDTGILHTAKELEEMFEEGYMDAGVTIKQRVLMKRVLHYSEASRLYRDLDSSRVLGDCEKIVAFNESLIKAIEECKKYELKKD